MGRLEKFGAGGAGVLLAATGGCGESNIQPARETTVALLTVACTDPLSRATLDIYDDRAAMVASCYNSGDNHIDVGKVEVTEVPKSEVDGNYLGWFVVGIGDAALSYVVDYEYGLDSVADAVIAVEKGNPSYTALAEHIITINGDGVTHYDTDPLPYE